MNTSSLLSFLDKLEQQGILATAVNKKIQGFLDYSTKSIGKLFLVYVAITGALFISAGVFAIISHNWDDFPKHLRGVLSFVPSLVALYVYYIAIFKHANSTSWIEAASLFLMLMIGASIALVSQTYQMDGDFDKFIIVWLTLTIPLFYIAKASGIALFYIGLSLKFLFSGGGGFGIWGLLSIDEGEKYYIFWLFFIAFLPHFYMALNKASSQQGFRSIFLGWLTAIALIIAIPFTIKGGYMWWTIATYMGFYLFGKKYYANNLSALGRPYQTIALGALFYFMLYLSVDFVYNMLFRHEGIRQMDSWDGIAKLYYFLGFIVMGILTYIAVKKRMQGAPLNRYIIFTPFLVIFLYLIYSMNQVWGFDMEWFGFLVLNFYILGFGINAMIHGNKNKNIVYMFYGLFMVTNLMWMRYGDMDLAFWLKGIFFIGVGFAFLLIHYLSADEFES